MLDLDSLAQARAKSVNERVDFWRDAVWSAEFQKLSANMSDGEVEALLASCPTARHLRELTRFLVREAGVAGVSPFTLLTREAEKAGARPDAWIRAKFGES